MKKYILFISLLFFKLIMTSSLFATNDLVTDFEVKNAHVDGSKFIFEIWVKSVDNWDNNDGDYAEDSIEISPRQLERTY